MTYAYLKKINVVYMFNNKKEMIIASDYLKKQDETVEFYQTKERRKDVLQYCIDKGITLIDIVKGDNYDSFDFAIPHYEKQFLMKGFTY